MDWFINENFWKDMYDWLFPPERFETACQEVEKIIELTNVQSGHVLDLCCGPGRHTYEFAKRGFFVTAVDVSEFLLSKAKEHCSQFTNVRFIHADMRDFVEPNHFDLVINMFTSFGYFENQEDNLKVLENIKKNLREDGKLLMEMASKEVVLKNYRESIVSVRGEKNAHRKALFRARFGENEERLDRFLKMGGIKFTLCSIICTPRKN